MQFPILASLSDQGVTVVPDIVANAGGVVASCFEWMQDLQCFFLDEEETNSNLSGTLRVVYRAEREMIGRISV